MPEPEERSRGAALAPGTLTAVLKGLHRDPPLPADASSAFRPGQIIGRFELVREIGRGGFGIVYEARDRELGRTVAFKAVLTGGEVRTREERLLREAEAAAILCHPNIITLHDIGRCEQGPYLVLELLHGCTLGERLGDAALPLKEAIRIGVEVAKALAHAHSNGVVHRDLTPGNVFLCDDGQVKVLDFGMAVAFGRRKVEGGTRAFMAPEQARSAPEDERTDVFALAVILYRMISGELPFASTNEILEAPPSALRVPGQPGMGELISRMLDKDPVRRPRDGAEVLSALVPLQRKLEAGHTIEGTVFIRKPRGRGVAVRLPPVRRRPRTAVAVLPFADMSPGKDQEYFSDGIAEEILNALSRVPGLRVAGRTSCFSFKGKDEDLRSIGRKLKVTAILEGSVRKVGERVRVTAQLISVANGYHLWSAAYGRDLTDVFAVQDEIASGVVEALKLTLLPRKLSATRTTPKPDAYNEYLLGRHRFNRATPEDYEHAVAAFEKAVALDARYGPAWAWLSVALMNSNWSRTTACESDDMHRASAAAEKSVEVAPELPECYSARAWTKMAISWDWDGARIDLERALAGNPRDPFTLMRRGNLHAVLGELPEAIATIQRATQADPLFSHGWYFLSFFYNMIDRPDLARDAANRALDVSPGHAYALRELGYAHLLGNEPGLALDVFERHSSEPIRLAGIAMAQHALGNTSESEGALEKLRERFTSSEPHQVALVHAWRGDVDASLDWMERSLGPRNLRLRYMKVDPLLKVLRHHPRYALLLRKLNLPVG